MRIRAISFRSYQFYLHHAADVAISRPRGHIYSPVSSSICFCKLILSRTVQPLFSYRILCVTVLELRLRDLDEFDRLPCERVLVLPVRPTSVDHRLSTFHLRFSRLLHAAFGASLPLASNLHLPNQTSGTDVERELNLCSSCTKKHPTFVELNNNTFVLSNILYQPTPRCALKIPSDEEGLPTSCS